MYLATMRGEGLLFWYCKDCPQPELIPADPKEQSSTIDPYDMETDVDEPGDVEEPGAESTRLSLLPDTTATQITNSAESTTAEENIEADEVSFDVTGDMETEDPIQESDMEDPVPTNSIVEDHEVRFEIIESGTKRGAKKLVSSDGFDFTLKKAGPHTTVWRCAVRRKDLWCRATVSQRGNEFACGTLDHIHPPEPGLLKCTAIAAKVRVEAVQHPYKASGLGDIVDDAFAIADENDFNLPNQGYLQRAANRIRQKLRPAEPTDLTFEIDQQFLSRGDFLRGDVRVDGERHVLFATDLQMQLLGTAKIWYLDGTFKIIRQPFGQLYSVHAFIQKDDCMKQVPLMFVMMSR